MDRRKSDLKRTDIALELVERANVAVSTMTHSGTLILRKPYPPPHRWVRRLILELQGQYDDRLRIWPIRNTLAAHDELLRLQGYLMLGGEDSQESSRASRRPKRKAVA